MAEGQDPSASPGGSGPPLSTVFLGTQLMKFGLLPFLFLEFTLIYGIFRR